MIITKQSVPVTISLNGEEAEKFKTMLRFFLHTEMVKSSSMFSSKVDKSIAAKQAEYLLKELG